MIVSLQFTGLVVSSSVGYTGSSQEYRSSDHSYASSPDAAFDGSNSTSAFLVIRGCDGQDCSQTSFLDLDYSLVVATAVNQIEFEWNIQPYESFTPSNSQTNFSLFNHSSMSWELKESVTGTISDWELVTVNFSNAYIDSSGQIDLRIGGFHDDTGDFSDELGIWIREFHLYVHGDSTNDSDSDGIVDSLDHCISGETGWISNSSSDYDGDGCKDATEDIDDDNDGVLDDDDVFPFNALEWADFDVDSIGDNADTDDDNDGVDDTNDSFPFNPFEWADFDEDSIGDNADTDDDNDSVEDDLDVFPYDSSEWSDNDNDSIGDNADPDDDNDGYSDVDESQSGGDLNDSSIVPNDWDDDWISDLLDDDDDNDGINDEDDQCNRQIAKNWGERNTDNSYSPDKSRDWDLDGCRDSDEDDDDDDDERLDGEDSCPRGETTWNSLDSNLDFDGDGCKDDKPEDDDVDNDGWTDEEEGQCGTDSKNAASKPADSDGDGICDALDPVSDVSQDEEVNQNENEEAQCSYFEWYCKYIGVEPGVSTVLTIFSLVFGFWVYRKSQRNSERLDQGSERFEKGERRFEYIEDEVEELEDRINPLRKNRDSQI